MSQKLPVKLFFILLLLCGSINFVKAQDVPDPADDKPIKVDTLLYTIPFTVTDSDGRHISGLKKENFRILQDGDEQEIDFFLDDQSPTNVAILIDTSISTKPVLSNIQKAAKDFIKVLRPEDKGLIVGFDYKTSVLSEFTSDRKKLSKAIDRIGIANRSGSAMNEAVNAIVKNYFASIKGRKAIIVLTDGIIDGKTVSDSKILSVLNNSETLLYPIIFKTASYFIKDSNQPNGRLISPFENLKNLADLSAGRLYEKNAATLNEAFQDISVELKKQYIIGYYPLDTGKSRRVRIRVDRQAATVQTRKSLNF